MTEKAISPLRRRLLEDMAIRRLVAPNHVSLRLGRHEDTADRFYRRCGGMSRGRDAFNA